MRILAAAVSYALLLGMLAACMLFGQPELSREVAQRPGVFRAERAMDDLRKIDALTGSLGGRSVGTTGNAAVSTYVGRRMEEAGLQVYEQVFHDLLGGDMRNVVGVLPGNRAGSILIGAHHDAEGESRAAVEATAGLAVLLELARAASDSAARAGVEGRPPSRTLIFASWDGESFGCAGANHFVDTLAPRDLQSLRAMVSLDAVGWRGGRAVLHTLPYEDRFGVLTTAPDWLVTRASNAARARGESLPVGDPWLGPVYQVLVRTVDVGYYSDDRAFLAKGVPAVFVSNFSLTRSYPHLGTAQDTIDQVDVEQIGAVGRSVEGALTDLSTAESLPVGEQQYLVLAPPFGSAFRLTPDQVKFLAFLSLLPGACVLLDLRRRSGLGKAGVLFAAFAALFVAGTLAFDPILFPALFLPALLASPLLAVRRPGAVAGHLMAFTPLFLFAALVVPVYATGSARLVKITGAELAVLSLMAAVGLLQVPLHHLRARRSVRERARAKMTAATVLPPPGAPPIASAQPLPGGAPGAS